jgi:N-acetyl-gamma-glutamyl-phosphate reductase
VRPLVEQGLIPADYPLAFHSLTGYSGGGKRLISLYQNGVREVLKVPRHYALGLDHKHLPEMKKHTGLSRTPLFTPIVSNYYKGMAVVIPLFADLMKKYRKAEELQAFLSDYYQGEKFVKIMPLETEPYLYEGGFDLLETNDSNKVEIFVFGNQERLLLIARLDNLGKGASGAAVQNMNLMMGVEESKGLL